MARRKELIDAIIAVMSTEDALFWGIHIDMITDRLIMSGFPVVSDYDYIGLRTIANKIILSECRKPDGLFRKVFNEKTGRSTRGMYRLGCLSFYQL